ncbi:hypothetical protein RUND412_007128 [Rhizina undulata]
MGAAPRLCDSSRGMVDTKTGRASWTMPEVYAEFSRHHIHVPPAPPPVQVAPRKPDPPILFRPLGPPERLGSNNLDPFGGAGNRHRYLVGELEEEEDRLLLEYVKQLSLEDSQAVEDASGAGPSKSAVHLRNTLPCSGCHDIFPKKDVVRVKCNHAYCHNCLVQLYLQAMDNGPFTEPRCCGVMIPIEISARILEKAGLGPSLLAGRGRNSISRAKGKGKEIARASLEPKIDCTVCMDAFPAKDIIITPCNHNYCNECMQRLFKEATTDESLFPPRCCKEEIPLAISEIVLSATELGKFKAKAREFKVKDRIYCFDPRCSVFIPPEKIILDVGTCEKCSKRTCKFCQQREHGGECPQDKDTQEMLKFAGESGWRRCYRCRAMMELKEGCNHITCRSVWSRVLLRLWTGLENLQLQVVGSGKPKSGL